VEVFGGLAEETPSDAARLAFQASRKMFANIGRASR